MGKKWEYKTGTYPCTIAAEAQRMLEAMNKLGADRWEAFKIDYRGNTVVVWFKRPLIEKQELTEG